MATFLDGVAFALVKMCYAHLVTEKEYKERKVLSEWDLLDQWNKSIGHSRDLGESEFLQVLERSYYRRTCRCGKSSGWMIQQWLAERWLNLHYAKVAVLTGFRVIKNDTEEDTPF